MRTRLSVVLLAWLSLLPVTGYGAGYTLTVNVVGPGTVTRNPTNLYLPAGATVTLTAKAKTNGVFVRWTGAVTNTNKIITVVMNADKTLTARFVPTYTLTTTVSGLGTVRQDPVANRYRSNTVVSVTAVPGSNWVFWRWSGGLQGTTNPAAIVMRSNTQVRANFLEPVRITGQPQGATAAEGGTLVFSVQAQGGAPLAYQWYFDDQLIPGATQAVLTLLNFQADQTGLYRVVVSNVVGSVGSVPAEARIECSSPNGLGLRSDAALRAAIAGGGDITLCFSGTLVLTNTIEVTRDVTLEPAPQRWVTISGGQKVRLFKVAPGVKFTLRNIILADGWHLGSAGTQTQAGETARGGAIYNDNGLVHLISCTLSNNQAVGGDGYSYSYAGIGEGGAVYGSGILTLENSLFVKNSAKGGRALGSWPPYEVAPASGGGLYCAGGTNIIINTIFATNYGGGCYLKSGSATVTNSVFAGSRAAPGFYLKSGSANFTNSVFAGNEDGGSGAGLYQESGSAVLHKVHFTSNSASGWGGGSYIGGTLLAVECSFSRNVALGGGSKWANYDGLGGGLYIAGQCTLLGCTIEGNQAIGTIPYFYLRPGRHAFGGGLFNAGTLMVTNCTVTGNSAMAGPDWGGHRIGNAFGGGIYAVSNAVFMQNVTLATNQAVTLSTNQVARGGNIAVSNATTTVSLQNTVLSGGQPENAWGSLVDGGYNLSSDGSCNFASGTSLNLTDPKLGALADNGGPTLTMALLPGSPAIDAGGAEGAPAVDQRGFPRPWSSGYDIGAFEYYGSTNFGTGLKISCQGTQLNLQQSVPGGMAYRLETSTNLVNWTLDRTVGPFGSVTVWSQQLVPEGDRRFFRLVPLQ